MIQPSHLPTFTRIIAWYVTTTALTVTDDRVQFREMSGLVKFYMNSKYTCAGLENPFSLERVLENCGFQWEGFYCAMQPSQHRQAHACSGCTVLHVMYVLIDQYRHILYIHSCKGL